MPDAGRRRPAQQRSRERVARILEAASSIIADRGSDQLKMSEIATLSGMSLGALYQYFPDKSAIVRTLAEQFNAASRECIAEALDGVSDHATLESAFMGLMDQYLAVVRAEPVMRDIWSGMQADRELAAVQDAETRACAALLHAALLRVHGSADNAALYRTSLLIWDLGEAAVRLSLSMDESDASALVAVYTRMALREMLGGVQTG